MDGMVRRYLNGKRIKYAIQVYRSSLTRSFTQFHHLLTPNHRTDHRTDVTGSSQECSRGEKFQDTIGRQAGRGARCQGALQGRSKVAAQQPNARASRTESPPRQRDGETDKFRRRSSDSGEASDRDQLRSSTFGLSRWRRRNEGQWSRQTGRDAEGRSHYTDDPRLREERRKQPKRTQVRCRPGRASPVQWLRQRTAIQVGAEESPERRYISHGSTIYIPRIAPRGNPKDTEGELCDRKWTRCGDTLCRERDTLRSTTPKTRVRDIIPYESSAPKSCHRSGTKLYQAECSSTHF